VHDSNLQGLEVVGVPAVWVNLFLGQEVQDAYALSHAKALQCTGREVKLTRQVFEIRFVHNGVCSEQGLFRTGHDYVAVTQCIPGTFLADTEDQACTFGQSRVNTSDAYRTFFPLHDVLAQRERSGNIE